MRCSVGLVSSIALTACFKGAPPPTTPPPEAPRPAKRSTSLGDPLAFLPLDVQLVVVVDFNLVRTSPLWKRVEALFDKQIAPYKPLFTECMKFEPLAVIRRMTLGLTDLKGDPHGVAVVQGVRRDLVMHCLTELVPKSRGEITIERDVVMFARGTQRVAATFADDTTLVLQSGPRIDAAVLSATLDGGAPLRMEPGFGELFGRVDPTHPMWLVLRDGSMFSGQAGLNAKSFVLSARVADNVALNLRMRFDDPAQASTLASTIQGQLPNVATMVDEITANADDVDLVLSVRMSAAQADSLITLIGPSLGIP